jgi:tRNA A-37 threonylcarbamoyl transferase component Bud32/FixJ family two-component response regulator
MRMMLCPAAFINVSDPGTIAPPRAMRFLIVDESSEFRRILTGMLHARWPQAAIDEWNPRERGDVLAALAQNRYDAVLLETLPAGEDGIRWVAAVRKDLQAPPVILMADGGDAHAAIQAMKAGAADFVRKKGLTAERLARAVDDALREHEVRRLERTGQHTPFTRSAPLEPHLIGAPVQANAVRISGYRVLRKIGEGGMAQVYLAERERDGLQLVLKVLDASLRRDRTFFKRFQREHRLLASIENEYVARIYDYGISGEQPYIALEYLSGGTLAARMQEGLTALAALRITSQVARALDAIHELDIVHRDLKPQNIMFRDTGRPVLVDFGLAKDLASDSQLTRHGEVMATPRYMSPEQCLGLQADARSDLYSLGAIFYEMLTGKKLFGNEGPANLVYLHIHGDIPRLPQRLAGYQPIIDKLLAKKPADRYRSARELFATIAV